MDNNWECVAELQGHSSWIYGVHFFANRMLASVSGCQILLWNFETQVLESVLEGHTDIIFSLSLSPDGKTLASGSLDKTVGLWDLITKKKICTLAIRKDPIHSVMFSPDGKFLASGGERKYKTPDGAKTTIYLWNTETKELAHTFTGHDLRINSLSFSPDGKTLASASNDHTIRLWDVSSGKQLKILEKDSSRISEVSFIPNDGRLISSGNNGAQIWNIKTGEPEQKLAEEIDHVRCFAIDPSSQFIAFEAHNGIEIWNLKSRKKLQYLDFKWPTSIIFSPDGKLLASGDASGYTDEGGLVRVWKVPASGLLPDSVQFELDNEYQEIESEGYFNPESIEDARQRTIASIVRRQGQAEFRRKLLEAYSGHCAITGCDVEATIEAAHIIPYQGTATNHITNGLPLRADIHTLFDLYLLSIDPVTYTVVIAPQLYNTRYQDLVDRKLAEPQKSEAKPSLDALQQHYEIFLSMHSQKL